MTFIFGRNNWMHFFCQNVFFFQKETFFLMNVDDILVSLWWPFGGTLVAFYESDTKVPPVGATLVSLS